MRKSDCVLLKNLDDDLLTISGTESIEIDPAALQLFDAGLFSALARRGLPTSNARRCAAVRALGACIDLISSRDEWRKANLAAPLRELQAALNDLELGYVRPILKNPRKDGGRPVSFFDAAIRGYVAGIMSGLMKHGGMSKSRAAAFVAERLTTAGRRVAAITVDGWRKEALENANPYIGERHRVPIERVDWSDPEATAERLIANLRVLELEK
jgi:hypothetical protein